MSAAQKMTSTEQRIFRGVYAATVCPLRDDFSPDEVALATHCRAVSEVKGYQGFAGLMVTQVRISPSIDKSRIRCWR
ncbi:MAG: hypothetical protein CM1200mP41_02390 [Gammaproteobacteria bacterium]|nr:MAG: hypothetical protein CM1200mP41_02390 [Gammaproteobacteria bacterium]